MRFVIDKIEHSANLMRRAGYVFQYARGGEESYVRVLARSGFPRFHCYLTKEGERLIGNIHLDQKKETYGRVTRHHGEYEFDGPLQEEIERIQKIVGPLTLYA